MGAHPPLVRRLWRAHRARAGRTCHAVPPLRPAQLPAHLARHDGAGTRGHELLLASNVNFPPGRYSALAGFLEAGESVEAAIHREVAEEVGIQVHRPRYFGSQSWPFPHSLMIAFTAEWLAGDIHVDPTEIRDARWFTPDTLPDLPPANVSISRALVEHVAHQLRQGHSR